MTPVPPTSIVEARLRFTWRNQGWTESYWLAAADYPTARTQADQLCYLRSSWLASDVLIQSGSVSFATAKHDRNKIPNLPRGNAIWASLGVSNDPYTGPMYRFQDVGGRFVTRLFRGCPDIWVRGGQFGSYVGGSFVFDPFVPLGNATTTAAWPPLSSDTLIQTASRLLNWICQYTRRVSKSGRAPNIVYNTGALFLGTVYRKIGKHGTGSAAYVPSGRFAR